MSRTTQIVSAFALLTLIVAIHLWYAVYGNALGGTENGKGSDLERVRAARNFLAASGNEKVLRDSIAANAPKVEDYRQRFANRLAGEAERQAFEAAFEEIKAEAIKRGAAAFGAFLDELALAYAEQLSAEDLSAAAELYRGPLKGIPISAEPFGPEIAEEMSASIEPEQLKAAQELLELLIKGMTPRGDTQSYVAVEPISPGWGNERAASPLAKALTLDQINAVIAFFQTPSGQRYLAALPHLTVAQMRLTLKWFQPIERWFEARLAERFPVSMHSY